MARMGDSMQVIYTKAIVELIKGIYINDPASGTFRRVCACETLSIGLRALVRRKLIGRFPIESRTRDDRFESSSKRLFTHLIEIQ